MPSPKAAQDDWHQEIAAAVDAAGDPAYKRTDTSSNRQFLSSEASSLSDRLQFSEVIYTAANQKERR